MLKTILAATAGMFGIPRRSPSTRSRGNKYVPHIGKKEQARVKRCYMSRHHGSAPYWQRSAPTMCQI